MSAEVKVLIEGYTNADEIAETGQEHDCATITLVRDGDLVMVVDPGVLKDRQVLIDKLKEEGLGLEGVNMICITHSHIDHYRNIGMFPNAKVIEYFGIWDKDTVNDWSEQFTVNVQILRTPGHNKTDITLFVMTEDGVVAICGDVFWKENYPSNPHDDPLASDPDELKHSRELVLRMADWIIPGHGGMYKVKSAGILETKGAADVIGRRAVKIIPTCKKCHRPMMKQEDKCLCRPWLCHKCCECGLDCDLCGCSHKK